MRTILKTICIALLLIGCTSSDDDYIIEPAGAAEYYLNNTTRIDLGVLFTTSQELGSVDSITTVAKNESKLIFTDGIIGVNPTPIDTFGEIKLYALTHGVDSVLLQFAPVSNDDWTIIEQDFGNTGYGLTKYQLLITEDDIDTP